MAEKKTGGKAHAKKENAAENSGIRKVRIHKKVCLPKEDSPEDCGKKESYQAASNQQNAHEKDHTG